MFAKRLHDLVNITGHSLPDMQAGKEVNSVNTIFLLSQICSCICLNTVHGIVHILTFSKDAIVNPSQFEVLSKGNFESLKDNTARRKTLHLSYPKFAQTYAVQSHDV